jgi:hypothetical protein
VKLDPANHIKEIIPGSVTGLLAHAYVASATKQNWLTEQDVVTLRGLLTGFHAISQSLPERVLHALWNHEYAAAIQMDRCSLDRNCYSVRIPPSYRPQALN